MEAVLTQKPYHRTTPVARRMQAPGVTLSAFLLLTLLFSATSLFAQPIESCGTRIGPDEVDELFKHTQELIGMSQKRAGETYKIPIQHHVVRQSNGSGGFTQAEVDNAMLEGNALFVQVNVELYNYGPVDFIDDDFFFFDCSSSAQWDSLRNTNVEPNAINIFWVPSSSGFPYCGLSSFTTSTTQGIVMNNACGGIGPSNSTMVHEIGHYFNLYHTHETAFGDECPSGDNCGFTGDLVCDTPADPNLQGQVTPEPDCIYTGADPPPIGCDATPYAPQTENIMSYSTKACRDLYTAGQTDRFRLTLENDRTELAVQVGDLYYFPTSFGALNVSVGGMVDTTVTLRNEGGAAITVNSISVMSGMVAVSGPVPTTLNPGETQDYVISFDATGFAVPCDLGSYDDIVTFTTTDAERPVFDMAVTAVVGLEVPAQSSYSFGPNCLMLDVGNTPGFSDLNDFVSDVLYDGSLLVGVINGSDTTVYQDLFGRADYSIIDGFTQGVDSVGRTTQTLQFLSNDDKIYGSVKYSYGANTAGLDSCKIIQVEYTLNNACDTSMTIAAGIYGDFDIDGSGSNNARISLAQNMVYVEQTSTNHLAGFVNLTPDSPTRGLVPVSNPTSIYPTGQYENNEAYASLVGGNGPEITATDVSALLAFGEYELPAGGSITFAGAIVVSSSSLADLQSSAQAIRLFYSPPAYLCGDADGNDTVTIADAVFLINFIFGGGPAPFPPLAGDANCDGSISITDVVYIINYIFGGGPAPCASCK